VAKGAIRPKSPFRGKLDLYYEGELTLQRSRRSDLHTLREFQLIDAHEALRRDLNYLNQAAYCAALIEQTSESDTPVPELFALFKQLLDHLAAAPPAARTVFAFELKLLAQLGLTASEEARPVAGPLRDAMRLIEESAWPEVARVTFTPLQRKELSQSLEAFLIYHLGKFPPGRGKALCP
jgi:DNA repair protein RecO (recombination protein O)